MRLAATIAIALLAAAPAAAVTPEDTFLAAVKACQSLSASSVANTSFIQNAAPLPADEILRMRSGHLAALAIGLAGTEMDQAAIDRDKNLVPVYQGWTVGPVTVVLMSSPTTTEFACTVSTPSDKFDLTLAELEPAVGYGKPSKTFTIEGSRVAAWMTKDARMPRAILTGANFDGQQATILQVSSP